MKNDKISEPKNSIKLPNGQPMLPSYINKEEELEADSEGPVYFKPPIGQPMVPDLLADEDIE